jgi:uncharacterized protein YfeS
VHGNNDDQPPPEHPAFAAHFTDSIYRASAVGNDDLLPFGTDEGFDTLWDWAERVGELKADPRLRALLGDGADELIAELRDGEPNVDDDAMIIATGFALLRFTGQIDAEGREWLIEVLQRHVDEHAGDEYDTMLADLATFIPPGGKVKRRGAKVPRPAPWLVISGGWNDPPHAKWLRQIAAAVIADPAWSEWWSRTSLRQLTLVPRPVGPPDGFIRLQQEKGRIEVVASSVALTARIWQLDTFDANPPRHDLGVHEYADDLPGLFTDLILSMLQSTAKQLNLPAPPSDLPRAA